ncbi:CHAT domain-containing protein [Streptomyces sp. NPDC041003]|uniref:CHAT domain-containing protein n=1 Tax=Streptomyces sp. NPDC041003 TaxID=3155730 RepID=UPI0033F0586B
MPEVRQFLDAVRGWVLPDPHADLAPVISYDGQVYRRCARCGRETRTHPGFAAGPDTTAGRCVHCGVTPHEPVVHLAVCLFACGDCGTEFEVALAGFEALACVTCGSRRLELHEAEIDPPFTPECQQGPGWDEALAPPEQQEELRQRLKHVWGLSASDDVLEAERELEIPSLRPDYFEELQLLARFVRRLWSFGGHSTERETAILVNYESSLRHALFRLVRDPVEGVEAVELCERAMAGFAGHAPLHHALAQHNFALYVFSLLREIGDGRLAVTYRPGLRAEAIAVAEEALEYFTGGPGGGRPGAPEQATHIRWALGDLLGLPVTTVLQARPVVEPWMLEAMEAVGEVDPRVLHGLSDEDVGRALGYLSDAIDSGHLSERLLLSARNSRAAAVLGSREPSAELRRQAIEDLEANVAALGVAREQLPDSWTMVGNLAQSYIQDGRLDAALPLLERVCAWGVLGRQRISDVRMLHAHAEEFVQYFDMLALVYARLGRPVDALCAVEWSRAATIRFHTMGEEERSALESEASTQLVQESVGVLVALLGQPPVVTESPPFTDHLDVLRARLESTLRRWRDEAEGIGFVSFSLWRDQVLAVVVGTTVRAHIWKADLAGLTAAMALTSKNQSNWREKRFRRLFTKAYRALWRPLTDILRDEGLTRLVVSAPGVVSGIAFEALVELAEGDGALPIEDITYLPSFSVAEDLRTTGEAVPGETTAARPPMNVLMVTYQGADLPWTAEEARMLQRTWGGSLTVLDTSFAAKREVLERLSGPWDLIHFAGHGSFDQDDPWNSALHLVEDPEVDSRRVTASDLQGIQLERAPVVVLSACSSALTGGSAINDAAGLTGAFLRAGAQGIVASRWPVYDGTALAFMRQFHAAVRRGTSAQAAVREAQGALQAKLGVEHWAAFSYVGFPS